MHRTLSRSQLLRTRVVGGVVVALAALVLAACGSGGSRSGSGGKKTYAYTFAASGRSELAKGIYLTVISPIKVPASAFKGGRRVDHAAGPEVCSFRQVVKSPPARYARFRGKTLMLKIYGKNDVARLICALARKSGATLVFNS